MNKRYMDFVPAKGKKVGVRSVEKRIVEPRPVKKPVRTVSKPSATMRENLSSRNVIPAVAKKPVVQNKVIRADDRLGIIEDLRENGSELNGAQTIKSKKSEIQELKAKKVGTREEKVTKKEQKANGLKTKVEESYKMPRTQFINQDKVVKRPLSKNVYRKEPVAAKEEPKGPVTIITKPEKSAKISLIVTIIITIILGAAAGTVAFLLLPK